MDDMTPAEREAFLVRLIDCSLEGYERGDADLAAVVTGVEATIESLFGLSDASWVTGLKGAWSGLEIIYAVMLDEDRTALTDRDHDEVSEVIQELRSELATPHPPPVGR